MDSCDFGLQNRVYQSVTSEHGLLLELWGYNHRLECLATAAYQMEFILVYLVPKLYK